MTIESTYWTGVFARRLSRRRALEAAGVGGAGLAAVAVGCGGGGNDGQTKATASPGGEVKAGGTYRQPRNSPDGLDVMKYPVSGTQSAVSFTLSRLLKYETGLDDPQTQEVDFSPAKWYNPVPDLAASWEIVDPRTYVFKLQPEAKWQNIEPTNGRKVVAEDILFGWQYYTGARADKGVALASLIDSVQAVAPDRVEFKLKQPFAPFLGAIADPQDLWIYPKELIDADGDGNKRIVGSGPWIFESLQRDVGLRYRRNPDYWLKDDKGRTLPYIDRWETTVIANPNTQLTQFQAGNIHETTVPIPLLSQFRSQTPNATLQAVVSNRQALLWFPPGTFDANLKPFNDVRIRRAVSMAIDRSALSGLASGDKNAKWPNQLNSSERWYLDPQSKEMGSAGEWFKYNPEKAKALLKEAGYDELNIDLYYTNNGYVTTIPYYNPVAEALPAMLKKANINATLKGVDYQSQFINRQSGIFYGNLPPNSIAIGIIAQRGDPDTPLFSTLHPEGPRNTPGFSRVRIPELTALVERQRAELNDEKRREIVYDIQRKTSDLMVYVPVIEAPDYTAYQPYVRNLYAGGFSYGAGTENYVRYWLDK